MGYGVRGGRNRRVFCMIKNRTRGVLIGGLRRSGLRFVHKLLRKVFQGQQTRSRTSFRAREVGDRGYEGDVLPDEVPGSVPDAKEGSQQVQEKVFHPEHSPLGSELANLFVSSSNS